MAAVARPAAAYAELQCQSAFSFLRGASEPETLVARAAELGYAALALTDRDGLYGTPRFHKAAAAAGLHAIHGITLTLSRAARRTASAPEANTGAFARTTVRTATRSTARTPARSWTRPADTAVPPRTEAGCDGSPATADDRVVLLAEDDAGWSSLCRLSSAARHISRTAPVTPLETLAAHRAGLLALAGPHLPEAAVTGLREVFGQDRLFLAIHDRLLKRDLRGQALQRERSARFGVPLLVTGGVRFARRADKPVHDVLTCVRHKLDLEAAGTRLLPNAEFCLRPIAELAALFRHCPDALARTLAVAERCRFDLARLAYRFPTFAPPPGETSSSYLRALVQAGAHRRYRPLHDAAARQIARELELIERLDLAGYFLLVHEIVRFCEDNDILCQGRGSAANSAVCYALGITSVDPVGMGLLFERFLSENRGEMPDIDLDIEHQRREEVLQHVYARYGRDHAALAAEVVSYRARSAVRDAGKALGFTLAEVESLASGLERRHDGDSGELPAGWTQHRDDPRVPHLLRLVAALSGLPRHLSIHVGGMIITGPPLTDVMPVEPAAMPGRTVVPWDKDDLSALGILKIDLLGLGMLSVLARSFRLVNAFPTEAPGRDAFPPPEPLALHTVPSDDTATWELLCRADTVGVFQVESRAQMNCLPRLRPRCFYDLVVEVALIRPGPIHGDMVHPYLRRRAGREAVTYPHPSLRPILERTLGVPLFQEQGMRIAMSAAGFTGSEADELRRAMGHKRSHARMAELSRRLIDGLVAHGIPHDAAQTINHQLAAFADYGFPESHAASFARLAWASAWLKAHHPAHFLCALLNSQPMGFYAPAVLVSDSQRHGVTVLPVDVLQSDWDSRLQWVEVQTAPTVRNGAARTASLQLRRALRGARLQSGGTGVPDTAIAGDVSRNSARAGGAPKEESAAPAPDYAASAESSREAWGSAGAGAESEGESADESAVHVRDARCDAVGEAPRGSRPVLGVRLGLCTVRGLGPACEAGVRAGLASVGAHGPFVSAEDFARRTGLERAPMESLARLGALEGFAARRRDALWAVAQMARRVPGPLAAPLPPERAVRLPDQDAAEVVRENYRVGGISVERHPLELLRAQLDAAGALRARDLLAADGAGRSRATSPRPGGEGTSRANAPRPGGEVWVAGMVICRQRPTTARGLTFVTLEDETGFVNLIVEPVLAARDRDGLHACLLLAVGRLQRADGVVNIKATRLISLDRGVPIEGVASHDYR